MDTTDFLPAKFDYEFYKDKTPEIIQQMCPWALACDTSSSMQGDPINQVNRGLKIFQTQIQNDSVASKRVECAVVTFGDKVEVKRPFSVFEGTAIETLTAYGPTPLAEGVLKAIMLIEARILFYKKKGLTNYRPQVMAITDGAPTSSEEALKQLEEVIWEGVQKKKFLFQAFGVEGADMDFLKRISHESCPPQDLKGVNIIEFFKYASLNLINSVKTGKMPNANENPFQFTF